MSTPFRGTAHVQRGNSGSPKHLQHLVGEAPSLERKKEVSHAALNNRGWKESDGEKMGKEREKDGKMGRNGAGKGREM